MGVECSDLVSAGDYPTTNILVGGYRSTLGFADCTDGVDCRYFVLTIEFSDVIEPPPAWLKRINDFLDLVKVANDDGFLGVTYGVAVGEGALPVAVMKQTLDYWVASLDHLSDQALEEGIVVEDGTRH